MVSHPSKQRSSLVSLLHAPAVALGLALLTLAPAANAQTDADKAAARELATQGIQALGAKNYTEALDLGTRAESLMHAPTHVLLVARANAGLGHYVAAQEAYMKLIREELAANAPQAFRNAQQAAKDELPAIQPKIAQLRISLDNAAGRKIPVKMDDQPVADALLGVYRPVDPGKHEVVATAPGLAPVKQSVELASAEKKEVKLAIPDAPPGAAAADPGQSAGPGAGPDSGKQGFFTPMRIAGFGVAALGIGGGALGLVFTLQRANEENAANDLYNGCPTSHGGHACSDPVKAQIGKHDNAAASDGTLGLVGFVGGGVLLATGVTLIIVGGPKSSSTAQITPWFSGNMGGVSGTF